METASDLAPAAASSLRPGADKAVCESCGEPFRRRTSERTCANCLAPLRRLRGAAGLTQAELARRVGCRPATVGELERNRYHPALTLAQALANELGVDVLQAFPSLEITKVEAQKVLGKTGRSVAELCQTGELPCNSDDYWHRIPLRAVLELRDQLEELRRNWLSLNAAARETGLPWWVLRRLYNEGAFGGDVKVVNAGSAQPRYYVKRSTLDALYRQLVDEHLRVRCPQCGLPVRLGRKAHGRCLGPLGSRTYWKRHAAPEARAEIAARHGELVRQALVARPAREIAAWYLHRFGSTKRAGQLAKQIAESEGKKVGRQFTAIDAEKACRILSLADERRSDGKPRHSQRAIARLVGVSRGSVENVLRDREGVVSHFHLDEVA